MVLGRSVQQNIFDFCVKQNSDNIFFKPGYKNMLEHVNQLLQIDTN